MTKEELIDEIAHAIAKMEGFYTPARYRAMRLAAAILLCVALSAQTRVARSQLEQSARGWYYAPLSFGTLAAHSCAERNFPAPGVSPGMAVSPGWPTLPAGLYGLMYTGADVVVVRICNATPSVVQATGSNAPTFSARVDGGER